MAKRINIRLEGGIGDHLLGNRFIPAILDKYGNDAKICAYSDSNGKTFQKEALQASYSRFYDEIRVIEKKKYENFWVDCQFGTDNYYGALENVPDDVREGMERDCDAFYDLHIDSLKWMNHDFNWLPYFWHFPKPDLKDKIDADLPQKYVVMHLHSATSKGHLLEQFFIDGLVEKVSEFVPVVLISTPETNKLFEHLRSPNVAILNSDIADVFHVISKASCMISTDSGFRYLAYGCGVPVLTFSANCVAPREVPRSHMIRWLMFPETTFPLNYSFTFMAKAVKNILENRGHALVPFIENFDMEMVNRKYTINKEKTK